MRAFLSTKADTELMIFYGKFVRSEMLLMSAIVLLLEKPEGACHLDRIFKTHKYILLYNYCIVQHDLTFIRRFQSSSIQRNVSVLPKLRTVTVVETCDTLKSPF